MEAHADLAEDLLGLAGTAFTGADAESASRAVAIQVSHQVEVDVDAAILESSRRGERSKTYREGDIAINPMALRIVRLLIPPATSGAWPTVGSIR